MTRCLRGHTRAAHRYEWTRAQKAIIEKQTDSNRTHLLVFTGTVSKNVPWWWNQHRVVAANYLHAPSRRILIDGNCPLATRPNPPISYSDLLLSSDFAFTPGRGGPSSYRFAEALIAGSVPVVTTDQAPLPFVPEVDWSDCVVVVHETRIVALEPALLELQSELPARRLACTYLLHHTVGDSEATTFRLALRLWAQRLLTRRP